MWQAATQSIQTSCLIVIDLLACSFVTVRSSITISIDADFTPGPFRANYTVNLTCLITDKSANSEQTWQRKTLDTRNFLKQLYTDNNKLLRKYKGRILLSGLDNRPDNSSDHYKDCTADCEYRLAITALQLGDNGQYGCFLKDLSTNTLVARYISLEVLEPPSAFHFVIDGEHYDDNATLVTTSFRNETTSVTVRCVALNSQPAAELYLAAMPGVNRTESTDLKENVTLATRQTDVVAGDVAYTLTSSNELTLDVNDNWFLVTCTATHKTFPSPGTRHITMMLTYERKPDEPLTALPEEIESLKLSAEPGSEQDEDVMIVVAANVIMIMICTLAAVAAAYAMKWPCVNRAPRRVTSELQP